MFHKLKYYFKWNGCNIGPGQGAVNYMNRMADRGRKDLGFVTVIAVYLNNVADQVHSILRGIV